jgi:hypothetical protein
MIIDSNKINQITPKGCHVLETTHAIYFDRLNTPPSGLELRKIR